VVLKASVANEEEMSMTKDIGFLTARCVVPLHVMGRKVLASSHPERRELIVNGMRVETINIHAYCVVPEAAKF
jgi:hypothetical protein